MRHAVAGTVILALLLIVGIPALIILFLIIALVKGS